MPFSPNSPVRQRGDQDHDREEDARVQVAEVQRGRGEVPERGAEGKGREHRRPVVGLASLGRDAVDRQRALAALPNPEDRGQDHRPQQRRPRVGDVDVEMQEIRDAGPRDRDREGQRPVGKRPVATGAELQQEPHDDHEHLEAAAPEVAVRLQVIRRGLPAGGRQDLHHPEEEDDLRNLRRDRRGKETTDQRKLGVPLAQIPRLGHSLQDNRSALDINRPRGPIFDASLVGVVCDLRWIRGSAKMVLQGVVRTREKPYGDGVIDVRGVTKRYGEKLAVDDLTLSGPARES